MDDNTLLNSLMAALPEGQWSEVNRRLRAHPEIWEAAHHPGVLQAFLGLGADLDQWRPGPLGLAALSAQFSESEGAVEAWLLETELGQAALASALAALRSESGDLDLARSAAAAVGLRAALARQGGWPALAHDAMENIARWQLPLACLFGLVEEPLGLIHGLFQADPEKGPRLAAQVLLLNCATAEIAGAARTLAGQLSPGQALAFVDTLKEAGADDAALAAGRELAAARKAIAAQPAGQADDLAQYARQIALDVERAMLTDNAGDPSTAKQEYAAALQSLQHLSGWLSAALGRAAGEAGDPVSALAAYQAALANGSVGRDRAEIVARQAETLLALNRPAEALDELARSPEPAPLALARVHHALGQVEDARQWARKAAGAGPTPGPQADRARYYTTLAGLLSELGETAAALDMQAKATGCRPWDGEAQARLAEMMWQAGRYGSAHNAALHALAFGPEGPRARARKIVAEYLSRTGRHGEAIPHWQAALAAAPADASLALSLARSANAAGRPDLAQQAAQIVLKPAANGKSPAPSIQGEAHRILGEVAAAQGEHGQAVKHFEQAIALDPDQPGPWLSIAGHRRQAGDLAGALEVLMQAARRAPSSAEIAAALGHLYEDLGRTSDAIEALTRAADLAPNDPQRQRDLGLALYRHRYLPGAAETFRQALKLAPDDVVSLHHLALALLDEDKRSAEAFDLLQQAAALAPADPAPFQELGRLALRLHRNETALHALQAAIERQAAPGETDTLALLGRAHEALGDYAAALDAYRQAVSLAPTRADLNLRIGVCCLASGEIEAAIAALTEAVEADGASVAAHRELGKAYAAAGLWGEAAMAFEYAATLAPDDADLHHQHGRAALGVAKTPGVDAAHWHDRAVAALQRAAQIVADRPDARLLADLGHALTAAARLDEARQAFDAALVLAPASAGLRLDIAQTLMESGKHDRAGDLLAEAATLAPEDQEIAQAWARASLLAGRLEQAHKAFVRAADLAEAKGSGPSNGARRAGYLRQAGECIWSLGRAGEAIGFWQKALEIDPGDMATRARLGAALLQQGRNGEALSELERVLEAKALPAGEARLDAARAALGAGDYERALGHAEQAVAEMPADPEAHHLHGRILAALNKPLEALAAYREAARLDPAAGRYPASIARILAAQGEAGEAVTAAETALRLAGDQPDVLAAAGEVFLSVEDFRRAADVLRRAAGAQPDQPEAWLALARTLTLLVEAEAPWIEAGLPAASDKPEAVSQDIGDLLNNALHKAAVLGASPNTVREWTGRARAYLGDPKEAIVLLESAAAAAESLPAEHKAEIYLALAHAHRRDGALERARLVLETALAHARHGDDAPRRLSPSGRLYPLVLLEIGRTALALGDNAAALNAGRRAAAAAPRNAVLLHFLAEALLAIGDRREATAALERAIALQPNVARWHSQLAHTLAAPRASAEDFAAMLQHFRRAAALDPRSAPYALDLARALADDGDYLAAAAEYRRVTDLAPDSADAWREWGLLSLRIGVVETAAECFSRALALAPGDMESLVGSARAALALGNLNEAQAKANSALRLRPADPAALACLSEVCQARGDTTGALAANAKAIAAAPALPEAINLRLARARILRAAGRLDEAIVEMRRLTEEEPDSDEAHGLLGDALAVTRRFDEALEEYRRARDLAPHNAAHLLRLGRACLESGQCDQALAHLQQAAEYAAGPAEAADIQREIGRTYEARRQPARALEFYQEAIRLNPQQPENYLRAGVAHKSLGQYHEAQEHLQRVIDLDPSNVEAHRQMVQVLAFDVLHGARLAALRS